jgi:hypothetical protein
MKHKMKPTQSNTATRNPYRISAMEALENEGWEPSEDGAFAYARHAMFEATSPACCTEGCIVEPDGAMLPRLPFTPDRPWHDLR